MGWKNKTVFRYTTVYIYVFRLLEENVKFKNIFYFSQTQISDKKHVNPWFTSSVWKYVHLFNVKIYFPGNKTSTFALPFESAHYIEASIFISDHWIMKKYQREHKTHNILI